MGKPQNTEQYLVVTVPWIIIIIGLFLNTFCAVIVLRKQFRIKNIGVYLLALAILDNIYLVFNSMLHWGIEILSGVQIQALTDVGCSCIRFIIHSSRAMSVWILVVLTVERMLALSIPHLAKSIITKRRAIITTISVVIVQGALYCYYFNINSISINGNVCTWSDEFFKKGYGTLIQITDFVNYSLMPSVIMATSNSFLLYLLSHSQDLRSHSSGTDMRSVAIIVITTSIACIVLTMPLSVYRILYVVGINPGPDLIYPLLFSLDLLNHAINFLLYCISGASFRKELKVMFGNCCSKFLKSTGEGTKITSVNSASSSQPEKAGTSRMGSD